MALVFGGVGVVPSTRGQPSNYYALPPGQVDLIAAGEWALKTDKYCTYQIYDPITTTWRQPGGAQTDIDFQFVHSDGNNHRVANQTGCVVGGVVTASGSGYTSSPIVASSLSSGTFVAVVGGAVSTTVTVVNGGANYVYPPVLQIGNPPSPGVPATGYCTLSGGAVSTVTITDQGAGYSSPPMITFSNDPRDSTGYGASAVCVLTAAGAITALLCTDHGSPVTANTVALPTFTFSGGGGTGAAAYALMNWGLTSYTVTGNGGGITTAGALQAVGIGPGHGVAGTYTNPSIQTSLVRTRNGLIIPSVAAGTISGTIGSIIDAGIYDGTSVSIGVYAQAGNTVAATVNLSAPAFSGNVAYYALMPI